MSGEKEGERGWRGNGMKKKEIKKCREEIIELRSKEKRGRVGEEKTDIRRGCGGKKKTKAEKME